MAEDTKTSISSALRQKIAAATPDTSAIDAQLAAAQAEFAAAPEGKFHGPTFRTGGSRTEEQLQETRQFMARRQMQDRIANLEAQRARQLASFQNDPAQKRMREVLAGAEFGETVLGEGLGRLAGEADIERARAGFEQGLEGFSGAEALARREKAMAGIAGATQASQRQLQSALARAGVRGGVAGSQIRDVQLAGIRQKAETERDLFLAGEEARRQGLQDFTRFATDVRKFDLGQAAAEKNIVLQSGLGFAQLGSAERGAKLQSEAALAGARAQAAAACFIGNTLIEMVDGSYKCIKDLKLGDITSQGQVQGRSEHLITTDQLVEYRGIYVVGDHPVFDRGEWKRVKDAPESNPLGGTDQETVYDLWTSKGRIVARGLVNVLFTDYEGGEDMDYLLDDQLKRLNEGQNNVEEVSKREVRQEGDREGVRVHSISSL